MIILAVDASIRNTGLVVFDNEEIVYHEVLCPDNKKKAKDVSTSNFDMARINAIIDRIKELCLYYEVDSITAEQVISGYQNASATKALSLIAGMLYAVNKFYLPVKFIDTRKVKLAVTGKNNASKEEIIEAVLKLYPILISSLSSSRSKSGYNGIAEHIADAVAVYKAYEKENTCTTQAVNNNNN